MSIYWLIRVVLIVILLFRLSTNAYFLKNREKYSELFENKILNIINVMSVTIVLLGIVIIPSDPNFISKPQIFKIPLFVNWYRISGLILLAIGGFFYIKSIQIRRGAYGSEDTGKLITEGVYSFCRHPLYLGLSLIFLGLPLILLNFDALIVYPIIFFFFIIEGKIEERYDVGIRFSQEFKKYKKKTKIFGPSWFWVLLLVGLFLPIIATII